MDTPTAGTVPNQELKGPELVVAIKFVDELISLQVLRSPPPSVSIENNFPLFLVPKPGQPGGYRCIADGATGGTKRSLCGRPLPYDKS